MISNEIKQAIQLAYRQFLKNRNLQARYGQKLMIARIANTLTDIDSDASGMRVDDGRPHISVIEAGTGTGKTLAYLLATIPVAQKLKKKLLVSTATIALQEQIINKDLPEIKQNTGLQFDFSLAKGRGRYLCLSKIEKILLDGGGDDQAGGNLFGQSSTVLDDHSDTTQTLSLYQSMIDAMAASKWDGDRDGWSDEIAPSVWAPITTTHHECTGRRCSNVSNCSFFKARETIDRCDCIVANHDLVLADLALGGGVILPPPEETIYIFDEGHHLPEKALGHFAYHSRINATSKWLDQCQSSVPSMLSDLADAGQIKNYANNLAPFFSEIKQLLELIYPLCQDLLNDQAAPIQTRLQTSTVSRRYRFINGMPPQSFIDLPTELETVLERLRKKLSSLHEELQKSLETGLCPVPKVDLENWFAVIGGWLARVQANLALWSSYAGAEVSTTYPIARWLTLIEYSGVEDCEVCSSPILASDTLTESLWRRCYGAVVTSATLTALGTFDRFKMCSGIDSTQVFDVMPSAFHAYNAQLSIPDNSIEANYVQEHTDYLVNYLPELLAKEKGNLVLFGSRRQMEEVYHQLSHDLRKQILMQGDVSKQRMLEAHKKTIDSDKSSTLFGLASFAEGVDLPGNYCRHVILVKLPFSVPDDPVQSALAEWIDAQGGNAFMDISVSDASVRMIQACGRLLRTKEDSGTITILDKRLLTKRYGKSLLRVLPEYSGKSAYLNQSNH